MDTASLSASASSLVRWSARPVQVVGPQRRWSVVSS